MGISMQVDKLALDNSMGVITHLESDILEYQVGLRKHHYEQS